MENQELEQKIVRNERNKVYQKKLKYFYMGVYGLLAAWLLICFTLPAFSDSKTSMLVLGVFAAVIFVIWFVLCISAPFIIRCPHCDSTLYRADPLHITICPYCGTNLKIYEYLERENVEYANKTLSK